MNSSHYIINKINEYLKTYNVELHDYLFLDIDNCINNGNILKSCDVSLLDTNNKELIIRDSNKKAIHDARVNLVKSYINNEGNLDIISKLLLGLVHNLEYYLNKDYLNYRGLLIQLRFKLLEIEKQLSNYRWFDGKSKNTYITDLGYEFRQKYIVNNRIYTDFNDTLVDIIIETISRYRIILTEVDENSNYVMLADFRSQNHLDNILKETRRLMP